MGATNTDSLPMTFYIVHTYIVSLMQSMMYGYCQVVFVVVVFKSENDSTHTVEVNITCKDKSHTAAVHYGVVE